MTTIGIYNLKGGVGKTSSTINLAALAAAEGRRVLIWDLDPQGSASFFLQSEQAKKNTSRKIIAGDIELSNAIMPTDYEDLWIIPADLSASEADVTLNDVGGNIKKQLQVQLKKISSEFDIVFLDSPPGISLLQQNIFLASDWIIVPNIPTPLSMRSYDSVVQFFHDNRLPEEKLKGFFTMVDSRKNVHLEIVEMYKNKKTFLNNTIPYASDVEKMGVYQAPLASFAPNGAAAIAYYALWQEIKKKMHL